MADQDRDAPPPEPDLTVVDPPTLNTRRPAPPAPAPPSPRPHPPPAFGRADDLSATRPDQPPPRADASPPRPERPSPPPVPPQPVTPVVPEEFMRAPVHGDSVMRRVARSAMHPFRSAEDVRAITEHGRWIGHPVTTGRRIAVMGVREGAGKSTVSALVTTAYARHRDDRVLGLDLDPEMGSLPLRLGVRPEHPVADFAGADLGTASFEQVRQLLVPLGERLWALPTRYGALGGRPLDADLYRTAGVQLSRFFGVTVADNGAGIRTPLHQAVLAAAHAQILVAPATVDGAAAVGRVLDWLASGELRALRSRTLVVFTSHTPHKAGTVDVDRAADILAEVGVATIRLGFDRQLAVGTTLDHGRLAYATRLTAIAIAAEALRLALTV